MDTNFFRVAPYAATAWVWTLTFVGGMIFFGGQVVLGSTDPFNLIVALALGVMIVYSYVRSVRAYQITDSDVHIIRRGPGRISISRGDITNVESRPNIGAFFNRSFLGTGGLFGWAGKARVRQPTDINSLDAEVFGTNPATAVVLKLASGRTVVLTPANPNAFVAEMRGPDVPLQQNYASRRRKK